MIEQNVINSYADGNTISFIAESLKISERLVKGILIKYKEDSRHKKTFKDDFKKMIAERDINGVARSTIASELDLNISTIRKSCEAFGQAIKDKALSEQTFEKIEGDFDLKICPTCKSKKNNLVDDKTTFCMNCNSEHEYYDGYVLKLKWEYLEE